MLKPVTLSLCCIFFVNQTVFATEACGFQRSFDRRNKRSVIHVYEGNPDVAAHGVRTLAFVVQYLHVNTDGTRISYKVDDPLAQHGAINNIGNALHDIHAISSFRNIAAHNFEPVSRTWTILDSMIIEKDARTQKPCIDAQNYLVSMTSVTTTEDGHQHEGDCDQNKWLDALAVPTLVLPKMPKVNGRRVPTQFDTRAATDRSFVTVMRLDGNHLASHGIVGDKGPTNELGEASVAMNAELNGFPVGAIPSSSHDANARFEVRRRSVVVIFPGQANWAQYPLKAESVKAASKKLFDDWGGEARLIACLGEIAESH